MTKLITAVASLPFIFYLLSINTFANENGGHNKIQSPSKAEANQTVITGKSAPRLVTETRVKKQLSNKQRPDQDSKPRTFKKKKKLATDGIVGP